MLKNYYLVIIKKDGTIIHDMFATTHKDLVGKYLDPEEIEGEEYFKARFRPNINERLDDVDKYILINSGIYFPDWFCGEIKDRVMCELKKIINSMIIKTNRKILLHEGVILSDDCVIDEVKHCMVFGMYDNAKIKTLGETSIVRIMNNNTVIKKMVDGCRVIEMRDNATVGELHNYSRITEMYDDAEVGKMFEYSKIKTLKGNTNILVMNDEAHAERLRHTSKVGEMHGHATIEELWDRSVVGEMYDYAKINFMAEHSKVLTMYGDSIIRQMCGNAIIEKLYGNSLVRKISDKAQILIKIL